MDDQSKLQAESEARPRLLNESPALRAECLKLAANLQTRDSAEVVKAAQRYLDYITGTEEVPVVQPPKSHEERVHDEHFDLSRHLFALSAFINKSSTFKELSADEQDRLRRQSQVMSEYLDILDARIANFPRKDGA